MTSAEARKLVDRVRRSLDDARSALLELYQREGWRALGYSSWHQCATKEFGLCHSRVYQLLQAAEIEQQVTIPSSSSSSPESTSVDSGQQQIPERVLRPLAALPAGTGQRKEVYEQASKEAGGGIPTSTRIAELVKLAAGGQQEQAGQAERIKLLVEEEEEALAAADQENEETRQEHAQEHKLTKAIDYARKAWKHARGVTGHPEAEEGAKLLLQAKQILERLL